MITRLILKVGAEATAMGGSGQCPSYKRNFSVVLRQTPDWERSQILATQSRVPLDRPFTAKSPVGDHLRD